MTFELAVLKAARAVAAASLNMTTEKFWQTVPSLVVETSEGEFDAITVDAWRASPSPIKVVLASADTFGG